MANQLYTKEHLDKRNVYPKNYIENIVDKESGKPLQDILNSFNCYFLSYFGDKESTRLQVPLSLRKEGLWITYVDYNHNITIEYYNTNKVSDEYWSNSSNWRQGSNLLVGELSISANGNWVINGIETKYKAQGEKGATPLLRFNENKIQVSYDKGKSWENLSTAITDNFRISKYVSSIGELPTDVLLGTMYGVGPYYYEDDTDQLYPYYNIYVYSNTDNGDTWVNNGPFTSLTVGVSQTVGDNDDLVLSQKAVKDNFIMSTSIRNIDTSLTQEEIEIGIKNNTLDPNTLYLAFEDDE